VIEGYREKCETKTVLGARFAKKPLELDIPIYITGMSFGALSIEAKMALAKGASMAGTATCSGEGGMIPPERDLSTKWYYQVIQSRYGFNPHHLMLADAAEFFIGQGCKVGLGGHLMGQKVTSRCEMRSLPAGHRPALAGPAPGLARAGRPLAEDPGDPRGDRTTDPDPAQARARASTTTCAWRPSAARTSSTSTAPRAHGAGPHTATEETGIPLMAAIPEARRALEDVGLADEIDLVVAGASATAATSPSASRSGRRRGHRPLGPDRAELQQGDPGVTDYEGTSACRRGSATTAIQAAALWA
jgi:hypothetical protein